MKKTTLVMLALCAGLPIMAQAPSSLTVTSANGDSSFQLYGILDAGVGRVSHSFDFDATFPVAVNPQAVKPATTPAAGMFNGGISQTRWGMRGSTKLSDDFKAIFTLESAINVTSGQVSNGALGMAQNTLAANSGNVSADTAINGQLFSRSAYFGVSSDTFGTLTLGRHISFMLDTIPNYDALGGAQLFTPIGFSGSYGGGGVTDNSRVDNSLKYRIKFADFNFGYIHKWGGVTGSTSARGVDELIGGYESGPFGVQLIYQNCKDATSIANDYVAPNPGIKVTFYDTKSTMLAAKYQLGDLAVRGGWQQQVFTNPSNPGSDALMTSLYGEPVVATSTTPLTIGGSAQTKTLTVWWLGANYDVTKKFNVAFGYYHIGQNDFDNGTAAAADLKGTSKFTSVLLDYHFTKAFDLYAGYMANRVDGGLGNGYAFGGNNVAGLGARYMF